MDAQRHMLVILGATHLQDSKGAISKYSLPAIRFYLGIDLPRHELDAQALLPEAYQSKHRALTNSNI